MQKNKKIFVRTVTNFYVGEIVKQNKQWITLKNASWVADTGRFSTAMGTGLLSEVECYPKDMLVHVAVSSIVDYCDWPHELPIESK